MAAKAVRAHSVRATRADNGVRVDKVDSGVRATSDLVKADSSDKFSLSSLGRVDEADSSVRLSLSNSDRVASEANSKHAHQLLVNP